jgi:hypothetical protein
LGKLIRRGFTPVEVAVSYQSRGFDEGKKIRVLRDPLTWVIAILKCRFTALGVPRRQSQQHSKSLYTDDIADVTSITRE